MTIHPGYLAGVLAISVLALVLALLPALARADSIVYVKDGNVWLGAPDGSRQVAVTSDGTPQFPYRSPSQADDGTIAASFGHDIVVLRQNGEAIHRFNPPALTDSTSHTVDGVPVYVAISPDASKIAYGYVGFGCPVGTSCVARATSSVTNAAGPVPPSTYGQVYYGDAEWVSPSRLMVFGGFLHQINLWDLGQAPFHWFDDHEWAGQEFDTDLGDGDLSRDGRLWVGVRGYDSPPDNRYRHLIWFRTVGSPATDAEPSLPEAICVTEEGAGTQDPTIAPSGDAFAFERPAGIRIFRSVFTDPDRCEEAHDALVFPGGREPDWGPADVNPPPRAGSKPPLPAKDGGSKPPVPAKKAKLELVARSLRAACRRGLQIRLTGAVPGKATILIRHGAKPVAKKAVRVPASGAGTFTVRFSEAGAKRICVRIPHKAKLTVAAGGAKKSLTLRR